MRMISVRLQLISQVSGSSRWLADTAQLPRVFFSSIRLVGDVKPSLEFVHLEIDLDSGTFFFVKRKNGTMDVARVTCLVTCWVTCRVWASDVVSSLTLKSQKRPVGFGSKTLSNNTPLDGLPVKIQDNQTASICIFKLKFDKVDFWNRELRPNWQLWTDAECGSCETCAPLALGELATLVRSWGRRGVQF